MSENKEDEQLDLFARGGRHSRAYLIGSLRNPRIQQHAEVLRECGFFVFDDWYAAGTDADDYWKEYEQARGRTYIEALAGEAAKHIFTFDKEHLDAADCCLLVLPAGKSAHMEFGYMMGQGKRGVILLDKEDVRWDVMYKFADAVVDNIYDAAEALAK